MKVRLNGRARRQIREIRQWYRKQRKDLPAYFNRQLDLLFRHVAENPRSSALFENGIRRTRMDVFPYLVFYEIEDDFISVISVVHAARDPKSWLRDRFEDE